MNYLEGKPEDLLNQSQHIEILSQDKNSRDKDFNLEKLLADNSNFHEKNFDWEELLKSYERDEWNFEQNLRLLYKIRTAYFMCVRSSSRKNYNEMQKCFNDAQEKTIEDAIDFLQSKKQV